jgi:hypothetical protein
VHGARALTSNCARPLAHATQRAVQLGLTPPLGWNTWVTCGDEGCGHDVCNEAEVKSAATAMASNGMQALGFTYVNLVSFHLT